MFCAQGEFECLSRGNGERLWLGGLACAHGVGLSHQGVCARRDALNFKGTVFFDSAGITPGTGARAAHGLQLHDELARGRMAG